MPNEIKLLPCPFCGGEPIIHESMFGGFTAGCSEIKCCGLVCRYPTEAEAIEAWNTRHERTCELEPPKSGKRRCKRCGAFVSVDAVWDYCGVIPVRFCPNCGAKVIK